MRWLLICFILVVSGCPKEPQIIEIPGRSCLLRLDIVQPEGVDSFRSDLPGDEGRFSSLDLKLTRQDGELIERRLLGDDATSEVARFGEPINFAEGDRFDLEFLVRSPSGAVFALGRRSDLGCGPNDTELTVNLPVLPVNRWVTLAAPEVQRFEHESVSLGSGVLLVGGRTTPWISPSSRADAGPSSDSGPLSDAGGVEAGVSDAGPAFDAGSAEAGVLDASAHDGSIDHAPDASLPDGGATEDAGPGEVPACEPSLEDQLLGEPAARGVVYFEHERMRFVDEFEIQSGRHMAQVPRLLGASLFHQSERQRVLMLGGISLRGGSFCDVPPPAQFQIFDYSEVTPRLSSLTWGEDQRESHFALQRLMFPRAIPVDHDLMDVVLLGGYWGRHQTAPDADWPPRHDPPTVEMPHRMAVINASNFVSRRDNLGLDSEIRLPFQPGTASFGDGSALIFGGWEVDQQGLTEPSTRVYQLLRSNTAANIDIEAPHIYSEISLSQARAGAKGFGVSAEMVLVLGGLEAPIGQESSLELYRWRSNGRRGFREGGSLEHLPVQAQGAAQVWDRGFAATTLPCEGTNPCPVLVVGGEEQAGVASDRAVLLSLRQVEQQGQLIWQVESQPLAQQLPEGRWGASVSLLSDGSYFVAGGRTAPPESSGTPAQSAFIYVPYSP